MDRYESIIGTLLEDRYKVNSIIGIGGMSVVYEAEDILMNRLVAVKMLKDEIKQDESAVKRFVNESKAVAMLNHTNIVNIFDVSVKEDNKYIVMEYVDGINLKEYMAGKGIIPWQEAITYTTQILQALQHAHEKGIIHRDIKPQNILLLKNGHIKVADFGIAKLPNHETLTMTDKAIGTVYYISPEQASGQPIDDKSDIYSVGVMLYEMATGRLPFDGESPVQIAMMQVKDAPENPRRINPDIPKGLVQIILKAMSKTPENRYKSAASMAKHLSIIAANPDTVFSTTTSLTPTDNDKTKIIKAVPGNPLSPIAVDAGGKAIVPEPPKVMLKKRGMKKSRSMLPIISGVTLAFLIILAVSGVNILMTLFNADAASTSETLTIPDYVGKAYDETMKQELSTLNLHVLSVTTEYNDKYEAGEVISQKPLAGEVKKRASSGSRIDISLVISSGRDAIVLEDYSLLEHRSVEIALKELKLEVIKVPQKHDTILSGYVISTEPAAGVTVYPGDTIRVYVSEGQEIRNTIMPNVVGKTLDQAKADLSDAKVTLQDIIYEASDKPKDTVLEQSVQAMKSVPEKTTRVTLTLSKGNS